MCSGIPAGRGKAEVQRLQSSAIDAEQQEAQHARADGIARQVLGELLQQARGRLQHVLLAQDRLEEHGLRAIDGRRTTGMSGSGARPSA